MRRAEDLSCVTPSGLTQFADPTTLQSAAPYLAAWATFGRTGPTPIRERITPVYAAPGGLARSVQVQRSPATETPFGGTSAYSAPTRGARTTPTRSGSAPGPTRSTTRDRRRRAVTGSRLPVLIRVISGGQCQADRSAVSLPMSAATGTGAQPRTVPGRGSGLAPPCLAARRSAGCGGLGRPRRGETNVRGRRCGRSAVQPGQQRCAPGPST